jgi:hypothetical protein
MSTISQWCRYCGVENRPDAKSCYLCGKPLVAPNPRQQVPPQQPKNFTSQQKMMYNSRRKSTLNWRLPRFLIIVAILIFLVLAGGLGYHLYQRSHSQNQSGVGTVYSLNEIPTPSPSRTTYTNTKYGYSFVYPSQWNLSEFTFQNVDRITAHYQVATGGDAYPFEIGCMANPNGLDEQSWVKHNDDGGTPIGLMRLKSGETAFLSLEHGQLGTNIYTFTHNQVACEFAAVESNRANALIIESVVNSFTWR